MSRPSSDTIGPRFVLAEIVKAEEALAKAAAVIDDRAVADHVKGARKSLEAARKRARLILQDVALRTAEQPALFPTQEVDHGSK